MDFRKAVSSKKVAALIPRVSGLADQAFLSGIYFVQTAAYSRHLSTSDFGAFSLFYYAIVLVLSVQRQTVITPMIVSTTASDTSHIRAWQRGGLLISALAAAAFLSAWAIEHFFLSGAPQGALIYCAIGVAPLLAFEFHRRSLFFQRQPALAALCSIVFFLMQAAGTLIALWIGASLTVIVAIYIVTATAAALLASYLSLRHVPRSTSRLAPLAREQKPLILWGLASLAPYTVYNNAMPILVGALYGLEQAAIFAATRILVAPIMMLVSAVDSTDKPRAARALQDGGAPAMMKSLRNSAFSLLALGVPYLLVLMVFPETILSLAVGPKYASHTELIPFWIIISLAFLLGQPVESGLGVMRRADLFFWSRLLAAVLTLGSLAFYRGDNGALAGVASIAWSWGASAILAGAFLLMIIRRQAPRGPPADP